MFQALLVRFAPPSDDDEDIDTNEPGDLSPEDERLQERLRLSVIDEPALAPGVYQDGDTFYHEEYGPLIRFPGLVKHDFDMEGARRARLAFAAECPDLVAWRSAP